MHRRRAIRFGSRSATHVAFLKKGLFILPCKINCLNSVALVAVCAPLGKRTGLLAKLAIMTAIALCSVDVILGKCVQIVIADTDTCQTSDGVYDLGNAVCEVIPYFSMNFFHFGIAARQQSVPSRAIPTQIRTVIFQPKSSESLAIP